MKLELLTKHIPDDLRSALAEAAEVNKNYAVETLVYSVKRDVESALFDKDGEPLDEAVRDRRVKILILGIRARLTQIRPSEEGANNPLWGDRNRGATPL